MPGRLLMLTVTAAVLASWGLGSGRSVGSQAGETHHHSHKRLKHARIKAIKQDILNKLGLSQVPDVSSTNITVAEKRRMLKLYKKSVQEMQGSHVLFDKEEYYAKTFRSFTDNGDTPLGISRSDWESDSALMIHFLNDIPQPNNPYMEIIVHLAKLKLYKSHVSPSIVQNERIVTDGGLRVNVYQILDQPSQHTGKHRKKLIDSRIISVNTVGWEEFNIKPALETWLEDPSTNYGLEVSSDYFDIKAAMDFTTYSDLSDSISSDFLPTLNVLTYEAAVITRHKRSEDKLECVQSDNESRCCRYPLWVSFAEIGWDSWVIAPEGYQAYYCDGACPHRYRLAHNFAVIKSIINFFNPAAAPAPCCSATRLSSISLLHFNEQKEPTATVYEDMVVEECKCS